MVVSGALLLLGGGIEVGFMRKRSMRPYMRLMLACDGAGALAAVGGLVVA